MSISILALDAEIQAALVPVAGTGRSNERMGLRITIHQTESQLKKLIDELVEYWGEEDLIALIREGKLCPHPMTVVDRCRDCGAYVGPQP